MNNKDNYHTCEYCGDPADYFGPDPYNSEINDDYTEHWICEECLYNSSMEI